MTKCSLKLFLSDSYCNINQCYSKITNMFIFYLSTWSLYSKQNIHFLQQIIFQHEVYAANKIFISSTDYFSTWSLCRKQKFWSTMIKVHFPWPIINQAYDLHSSKFMTYIQASPWPTFIQVHDLHSSKFMTYIPCHCMTLIDWWAESQCTTWHPLSQSDDVL